MSPGVTSTSRAYLESLRRHAETEGVDSGPLLGGLARHLGREAAGRGISDRLGGLWPDVLCLPDKLRPPESLVTPDLLGWAYEALSHPDQRRRGLHYTPAPVALRLAEIALDAMGSAPTVCDPACGGGAFLLGAARVLESFGNTRRSIVDDLLVGMDVDPVAVAVATSALVLWCGDGAAVPAVVGGDSLDGRPWSSARSGGFDVVIGNPPFQSQLGSMTTRSRAEATQVRTALGGGIGGYVDTAALFLLAATRNVRPGGRVLLIQPQSLLASRDTQAVRDEVGVVAPLEGLWVCDEAIFEAATRVCAPLLRCGGDPAAEVLRWRGGEVGAMPAAARPVRASWAPLAAGMRGVPSLELDAADPVTDLGEATAGFRREFYGLVPFVREATGAAHERPLVTCGLIEPGACAWGRRSTRFAKRRWAAPVVDLIGLEADDARLSGWVADRLGPKVMVATQTRVIEAVADPEGIFVPSTPVISAAVDPRRVWHALAALLAPPVTAWALHQSAGTALSPDAVKLSARQVRMVPRPMDAAAWDEGADLARALHDADGAAPRREALLALATVMLRAYATADPDRVLRWWTERLPRSDNG